MNLVIDCSFTCVNMQTVTTVPIFTYRIPRDEYVDSYGDFK